MYISYFFIEITLQKNIYSYIRAILFIFRSSNIITREIIFFVCAKPQTKVTRLSTKGQHQQLVETLSEWIEQNLDKRIVIDDIAKRAGYSKWYLQRLFKEVTGDNLASYVRHRRLMRAAAELKRTDKKIMDITLQYGFESQQTFTRAFKRRFGTSPGVFRQAPSSMYEN